MIETESGEKELSIVPPRKGWGGFTWVSDHSNRWTFLP
jgi:hypothetical protein